METVVKEDVQKKITEESGGRRKRKEFPSALFFEVGGKNHLKRAEVNSIRLFIWECGDFGFCKHWNRRFLKTVRSTADPADPAIREVRRRDA